MERWTLEGVEMKKKVNIQNIEIGNDRPVYIAAEIGFNHEGDILLAEKMIEAAAKTGVNAVKFQTFKASSLAMESAPHYELIKKGEMDLDDHKRLVKVAEDNGLGFFSTPFCKSSVDILENLGVSAYKVASMDLTNIPLLKYIARTGKPMIVSTGMAVVSEIAEAIETIKSQGNENIILLHCVSKYPPKPEDANLNLISYLKKVFDCPIGYSDHVLGNACSIASVALGSCFVEKHFTIDKNLPGPDNVNSANTEEMKQLVSDIRTLEKVFYNSADIDNRSDRPESKLYRRGIYAKQDIPSGTILKEDMLTCVRTENGMPPKYMDVLPGKRVSRDVQKEEAITWDVL